MNSIQREIVDLLRASGSKLVRTAGKGGEVWKLPNGMTFITRTGKAQEHGVTHELADLRRKLGDVDVAKLSAGRKAPSACIHNWQKRGAALFCTRCYDIKTNDEQPQQEEQPKMEPLKIAPAAPAKSTHWKTGWTKAQDKIIVEGYGVRMSPADVAVLLQDIRPGVTEQQVKSRAAKLRAKMRSLSGVPPPGQGKGVKSYRGGVPIEMLTKEDVKAAASPRLVEPPLATMLPPVIDARPPPAPKRALAKVTFEIKGKVRVVEVDAETARGMLRSAMEL
ncbi:MAG: hypothetical protein IT381_21215 [Deltaproteobacteria bacterium]|nr:hypothetical protein [Deltaproteobacteria bacterium]